MTLDEVAVGPAVPEDAAEVRRLSVSFTPSAGNVPLEDFYSRFASYLRTGPWRPALMP